MMAVLTVKQFCRILTKRLSLRAADFKLSDWYNVVLAAIRGDYDKADALLNKLVEDRNDTLRAILIMIRVQTFTPGGMDPAALQQAAAAYTETFGAVDELQASVAALRQVAPPE